MTTSELTRCELERGRPLVGSPGLPAFLAVALAISTVLRFPALLWPLTPDEAGFSLVARSVAPTADSLYGTYWVDRSPVLVAAYALFEQVAGPYGMRVFSAIAGIVIVWAVYVIAERVGGAGAARLATVAVVALQANPEFTAWTGKGEVFGTALVAVSVVCTLRAFDPVRPGDPVALGFGAGACALLAVGMKQSLLGGFVFGGVFVVVLLVTRRTGADRVARFGLAALGGACVPVALTCLWVLFTPASIPSLWYQVVGFRTDASAIIAAGSTSAPYARAHELWHLAISSGVTPGLMLWAACLPWALRRIPAEAMGLLAVGAIDLVGVLLGGSYWHAYLIPLLFDASIGLAVVATMSRGRRLLAGAVVVLMCWASVQSLYRFTTTRLTGSIASSSYSAGRAIHDVADRDETIVSLYGSADVVWSSGLSSPYEHLWSLPMRTLDPDLHELKTLLQSDDPPTWVVASLPLDSWGIDHDHSLQALLDERYEVVSDTCGETIYHVAGITPTVRVACHDAFGPWS